MFTAKPPCNERILRLPELRYKQVILYVGPQFVDDPFYLTFLMAGHINYVRNMPTAQREREIAAKAAAVAADYDNW